MNLDPVLIAIPMFIGLILLELIFEYFTQNKTYRISDAFTNISTGMLSQVSGLFVKIVTIGVYIFLYENFAIWNIPNNWLTYIVLFFAYDLCYYWFHRKSHEISLFWGGHVVHHQSEDYNLSVALRQSSTSFLFAFMFYLPLAILGFDPTTFVIVSGLNLLYQFWIHTEHIDKMGWFEVIFNTPSHHRVHHARDPKYIDKNYAGVFIIWDKMFGTFKEEEERPNYGITVPLKSWNPIYANFAHYIDLFKQSSKAKNLIDFFKILFKKPGWMPHYLGGYKQPQDVDKNYKKYDTPIPFSLKIYLLLQFVFTIAAVMYFLIEVNYFPSLPKVLYASWIVLITLSIGLLAENKWWAYLLELFRLTSTIALFYFIQAYGFMLDKVWLDYGLPIFVLFSILFLISILYLSYKEGIFSKKIVEG